MRNKEFNKEDKTIATNKTEKDIAKYFKAVSQTAELHIPNGVTESSVLWDNLITINDGWAAYIGTCPHCGSANIEADYSMVLTSMPPQYKCRCKDCKGTFFSGEIKQENQTINPAFPLGPQTPFNPPYTPTQPENPNYDYGYGNYGWICPKCGKVNAPHRDFCDCSGGGYYPNIVYCNGSGNNPNPAPTITVSSDTAKENNNERMD